jgi:hypothetical protein
VSSYDQEKQILQSIGCYELFINGNKLQTETENFQVRLYQYKEIDEWLKDTGFQIISRYGDYNRRPSHEDDELIIYECEKVSNEHRV